MKTKKFHLKTLAIALASITVAAVSSCSPDNSVGKDSVGGTGGGSAPGTGGSSPEGTGGATISGTGGAVSTSSGGSGTGGSGTGTGGSMGTGGSGTGTGGSTGSGGRSNTGGSGIAGAGGMKIGTGGTVGSMGGAGPVAAGGDSKCSASVGKLCDGFEVAAIGATGSAWTALVAGGSAVTVDTTKPYRGTKSAHFTMAAGTGAQSFITETQTFSAAATAAMNDEMWGRMFVWMDPLKSGTTGGHFVFIRAEGTIAPGAAAASSQLHVAGGYKTNFAAEIRTTTDLYKYETPNTVIPQVPAKWQCWEWHTTGTNTLDFYIDGKIVPGMSVTAADKWPFPNFNKLYLGFLQFSAPPVGEMWIDEVALGTTQIGCDN